jgi:translation initiation factor 4G
LKENEKLTDNEKREEQKAALEEEHFKLRQRANGTVKFIGELFKIDMLTAKIMRTCIEMLLNEATEEKVRKFHSKSTFTNFNLLSQVERVCKLLTTIGARMEQSDEGRMCLNKYFSILNSFTSPTHKVIRSSRIKFEIQNLDDLRNNNWKARRQEITPKTMDQLQWEADQEQQMINYNTRQNNKDDRQRGNNQGTNLINLKN